MALEKPQIERLYNKRAGHYDVTANLYYAADFVFPERVDGVISTFALTMFPEFDRVIESAAAALSPGKRLAVLDTKKPRWPHWLVQFLLLITSPFGVTMDLAERHPRESIARHMRLVALKEIYFGLAYIEVGQAR